MKNLKKNNTIYLNDGGDIDLDLRSLVNKYSYHWKWYILGVIFAISIAFFYLKKTPNQYSVSTTIFIDDQEKGGLNTEMSAFQDLGFGGSKTSIINEMGVLKSVSLIEDVIANLRLNITYYKEGDFRDFELYENQVPFKINFLGNDSLLYKLDTSFIIHSTSDSDYSLKNLDDTIVKKYGFGEIAQTSFGEISITPKNGGSHSFYENLIVKITPISDVTESYREKLEIEPESTKSSLLIIRLNDPIKKKAEDFLDNLVLQYNNNAINYKRIITNNTDKFINERISDISKDLNDVDLSVESFKTRNKLTDLEYEASLNLTSNSEIANQIVDLTSQIRLIDYVISYINNNKEDLIPANLGLNDGATRQSVMTYNTLLMERNRILEVSSIKNPTITNLDTQLSTLRQSIEQSLYNSKSSLTFSLNEAKIQEMGFNVKKERAPQQEREFQDIKRKQQIIETLYLYLLQKREENAISLGMPVPNAKVVDKANGSNFPVAPRTKIIYLIATLIGFIIVLSIVALIDFFDNKVHNLEDLESIIIAPILGEIPKTRIKDKVVVKNNENDSVAEAFRHLRTNLNFMLPNEEPGGKVVMVSSTIGGEGKTFVSINLATVLASLNKKVLLIGSDLRKPKVKEYLEVISDKGLSNYLADSTLNPKDIVHNIDEINIDIIESGEVPPNPSELLMNNRFSKVLDHGREHYDYIIIDTAPLYLVTDTLLIGHLADLFIYVIRANYLDKRMLKRSKDLFENKRLSNMAMVLNDVDYKKNGYGYGYGYGERNTKKWWQKKIV